MILFSFTEGAGRTLLNQRKSRHELGVLEGPGEKKEHTRETYRNGKRKKLIHRAGRDLRSY